MSCVDSWIMSKVCALLFFKQARLSESDDE